MIAIITLEMEICPIFTDLSISSRIRSQEYHLLEHLSARLSVISLYYFDRNSMNVLRDLMRFNGFNGILERSNEVILVVLSQNLIFRIFLDFFSYQSRHIFII